MLFNTAHEATGPSNLSEKQFEKNVLNLKDAILFDPIISLLQLDPEKI